MYPEEKNYVNLFGSAKWIWNEEYDGMNVYVRFFDKISGKREGSEYKLLISVDTNYALYINGVMAETGQYADYPFDKVYDELDITHYLSDHENEIVIDCWHQGHDTSTLRRETAGLIYEIYRDEELIAFSSENTPVTRLDTYDMGNDVEFVSGQLGQSFRYDSRRELKPAVGSVIIDKPYPVRSRPIKKLVIGENEKADIVIRGTFRENGGRTIGERMQYSGMSVLKNQGDTALPNEEGIALSGKADGNGIFAIIDTSRENAGILSLDIDVPHDCEILIGWGEHLDDMHVRAFVGGRNFCARYYAKSGRNIFVNPFRRLGLRYLQLNIYSAEAKIRYAGIKTTDYPISHDTKFSCADNLHNRIYDVSKRTLLMCMHEHYEDCPWREQALYSMDSRNQMLCGYYAFKEFDFAKASIRLMAQSIRDDNMLELCSPARVSITIPSFSAMFLTQLYEYLVYSGDKNFAAEMIPYAKRIADEFIRRSDNEKGLVECFTEERYWNFYEWQDGLSGSIGGSISPDDITYDAPLCAFVSFGLRSLADTLNELGDTEASAYYREKHLVLNENINKYFWDDEKGAYVSYMNRKNEKYHYSELTNSLVVYADAADGTRLGSVLEKLSAKSLIPVTLSHSVFKYEALLRRKSNARSVFAEIAARWGSMLYDNATTFWETDDGAEAFDKAGSLCHGWSAIPIYLYHKYAVGKDGAVTGVYECSVSN